MSKVFKFVFLILIVALGFVAFKIAGPTTKKTTDGFLYIKTGTTLPQLHQQLMDEKVFSTLTWFKIAEKALPIEYVKSGKYKIENGMSTLTVLRMLRNGSQTPVKFVITKLRTKEQLAARMAKYFEFDSLTAIQFLANNDSLAPYDLDTNTVMAVVQPLTYENNWNTTPRVLFDKFHTAYKLFWTEERKQKAAAKGITPLQAITMASIVDEESNAVKEKGTIASVYFNRIEKGMPLQADPTVKYALKDFSIKRVLHKHLTVVSPYNTYKNRGLPPGPICTPQQATVDAVLDAPQTEFIYFVASPDFDGTHQFSTNYTDHLKLAKAYQDALNIRFGKIQSDNK